MTLRDLSGSVKIRRDDDLVEFRVKGVSYFGVCWQCRGMLYWDNWTSHREPIRTWCSTCEHHLPLIHLNLEPDSSSEICTLTASRLADSSSHTLTSSRLADVSP